MSSNRPTRESGRIDQWPRGGDVARPVPYHNRIAENIDFIFVYLKGKQCVPLGDGYDLFLTAKDHFIRIL